MQDVMAILNQELLREESNEKAFSWIEDSSKCPLPEQAIAAARCWLTHRAKSGLLQMEEWVRLVQPLTFAIAHNGHQTRWELSNRIADVYCLIANGRIDLASRILSANDAGRLDYKAWTPALLQTLRLDAMSMYLKHLTAQSPAAVYEAAMKDWLSKDQPSNLFQIIDTMQQSRAMAACMIIAWKAKIIGMAPSPVINPSLAFDQQCQRQDFEKSLQLISSINPTKSIW